MAIGTSKTISTASGLFEHFRKGKTVLGLMLVSAVVGELKCLNKSLQKRTQTLSGMQAAVDCVHSSFYDKQNNQHFVELIVKATAVVESAHIQAIEMPNSRRFYGKAVDYNHAEFFKVLDNVDVQFADRFDQESLKVLQKLESVLLTGQVDYTQGTVSRGAGVIRTSRLRLLLVMPASSCEAERSFSALRMLKTWVRANMTQDRLNGVVVCHVHRDKVDQLDRENITP